MNQKKILITGGTGFLGLNLIETFSSIDEIEIWVGIQDLEKAKTLLPPSFSQFQLQLEDMASIDSALRTIQPHIVIHCGAYGVGSTKSDIFKSIQVNIQGSYFLAKAAHRQNVQYMLNIGTAYEYGSSPDPISEKFFKPPYSVYGISKRASTDLLMQYSNSTGFAITTFRIFGLYGPHERQHKVIPQVIQACLQKRPLQLSKGTQIRDYTYVKDVAEFFCQLVTKDKIPPSDIFNLGSGIPVTLKQFVEVPAKLLDSLSSLQWGELDLRSDEGQCFVANTEKVCNSLNWKPKTSVEEGMREAIDFYSNHPR